MQVIRTLIVDDNADFRERLKEFLASEPDIEVVGEAADGQKAILKARELQPDLVVMDVSMPGISGIDATRQLKDEMPEVKVIVLTIFDLQEYREAAMASGASGYVIKKSLMEELLPAIKRALAQDSAAWARAKEELNITGGETTRQLNNPSHRGQPETYMRAQSGLFHQVRGRSSCIGLREHHPQRHPGHARGRAAGDQDFESFGRRT